MKRDGYTLNIQDGLASLLLQNIYIHFIYITQHGCITDRKFCSNIDTSYALYLYKWRSRLNIITISYKKSCYIAVKR